MLYLCDYMASGLELAIIPPAQKVVWGSSHLSCQTHVLEEEWKNPVGTGNVSKYSIISNFCTLGLSFWFFFFSSVLRKLLVTELSSLREEFVLKDGCKDTTSVFHVYMVVNHFSSSWEAFCRMSLFLYFKLLMKWNVLDQSHHMLTTESLNNKSYPGNLSSRHCTFLIFPLTAC